VLFINGLFKPNLLYVEKVFPKSITKSTFLKIISISKLHSNYNNSVKITDEDIFLIDLFGNPNKPH